MLAGLLSVLLPQCEADGHVEVLGLFNNGERPLGTYRQALLEAARGEYVSFVDDDDMVDPDFVPLVAAAMRASGPDYVAFRHAYYEDGVRDPHVVVTGLSYGGWYDTAAEFVRDITHINPARTVLARRAGFTAMGSGEDADYDARLRPLLATEAGIDRVLYHYYHSPSDSVQGRLRTAQRTRSARGWPGWTSSGPRTGGRAVVSDPLWTICDADTGDPHRDARPAAGRAAAAVRGGRRG